MELQELLGFLNSKEPIDFNRRYAREVKIMKGEMSVEEAERSRREDFILRQKLLEAEKSKVYINFFNKPALKMIKKSKNESLQLSSSKRDPE